MLSPLGVCVARIRGVFLSVSRQNVARLTNAARADDGARHTNRVLKLMDKNEIVVQTLASIQSTAVKIAAMPAHVREEALDEAHHAYASAMHNIGQDNVAAGRWVETVMTAVRVLIMEIDRNGEAGPGA